MWFFFPPFLPLSRSLTQVLSCESASTPTPEHDDALWTQICMYDDAAPMLIWYTDSFIYLKCPRHLSAILFVKKCNFYLKGSSKCVPVEGVYLNWLLTRLNFSARTTDRHCKCTDDVVTETCKICLSMHQMSLFPHNLSHVVIFENDIPYQCALSVESLLCFNWFCLTFLCETTPYMAYMLLSDILSVCVYVLSLNWCELEATSV